MEDTEAMGQKAPKKITSILSGFLKVLTKPQRKYFLIYLIGLIWLVKFRSIREIASQFGNHNTDGLHHFIKETPQKIQRLEKQNQILVVESGKSEEALMILDDTPCPRKGKKIQGLGVHYSSTDGLIRGLCAITAILKIGNLRLAWAIRGYQSKKTSVPGAFKSKVYLAADILQEAINTFPRTLTVLMDCWYACAPILNPLREAGWTFLAAVRDNRVLFINGRKNWASHLAKGPRKYKTVRLRKKRFRVAKLVVYLPQIGPALFFITKGPNDIRYFITNNFDMTESEMVKLYSQRFSIEIFHRNIKQILGFKEIFMRSWQGVQAHWTLVAIAHNLIALWEPSHSQALRQTIRHFRDSISHHLIMDLPKQLKITE